MQNIYIKRIKSFEKLNSPGPAPLDEKTRKSLLSSMFFPRHK